jgi:hypothetical protein
MLEPHLWVCQDGLRDGGAVPRRVAVHLARSLQGLFGEPRCGDS